MNTSIHQISAIRHQRGVTLVELMVALVLGLVITGGVLQVFAANRASYEFNDGLSRLQENGRAALETLSHRVRLAGYYGCVWGVPVTNNLNGPTDFAFDYARGLGGFEADGTDGTAGETFVALATDPANSADLTDWTPSLPADLDDSVIPGSDVLVVRNGSTNAHALITPFNNTNSAYADASVNDYEVGGIAVVSDCQKASVFQVTAVSNSGAGIRVDHAASGTPGNATAAWSTDQEYGNGAELLKAETWVYYVGQRIGGGPPALFQRRLDVDSATTEAELEPEELVADVDTMQVLYGIDAALDGAVDQYVAADAIAGTDWDQVVTVRVSLVMRSPEEYGTETNDRTYDVNGTIFDPVDDRRERHVFTTTIALRNRLP
jgi:type IV pilus assembly protein PilW